MQGEAPRPPTYEKGIIVSDQNTQDQAGATAAKNEATEAQAKLYASRSDAEAAKPADASKTLRPFEVSRNGNAVGWVLARGHDHAVSIAARLDGYTASLGSSAPITKEAVAAKLAAFTDAELAAMGLSRKPAKGAKK